jgi:uncharacterized repeat protein (TIGR03803 family)
MGDNARRFLARVFVAAVGALLGAAPLGGSASATPAEKLIYSFCRLAHCADGANPRAGLIADGKGNLLGTTYAGGGSSACKGGCGVLFKLSPAGAYTRVHYFTGADGANPAAGLYADSKGNLYGTTVNGGEFGAGTVFRLSPTGAYKVLHSFDPDLEEGGKSRAGLVADSKGIWDDPQRRPCEPRHRVQDIACRGLSVSPWVLFFWPLRGRG